MPTPQATAYALACDQIATLLASVVLSHDTGASYNRITDGSQNDPGPAGYRSFWFEFKGLQVLGSRGRRLWTVKNSCELNVRIHLGGKRLRDQPNTLQLEIMQVSMAVDTRDSWTGGVETVSSKSGIAVPSGDDAILKIMLDVFTQEAPNV